MKIGIEPLTAQETLDLISHQWCTKKDLKRLAYVGDATRDKMWNEIVSNLAKENKKPSRGGISMEYVVKYLGININYLKKVAK